MIMDEMRKLPEVYKAYAKASFDLLDDLEDEEVCDRATIKAEHYTVLVDDIITELKERIWNLCLMFQSPLPSKIQEELAKYDQGRLIPPGFILPRINS